MPQSMPFTHTWAILCTVPRERVSCPVGFFVFTVVVYFPCPEKKRSFTSSDADQSVSAVMVFVTPASRRLSVNGPLMATGLSIGRHSAYCCGVSGRHAVTALMSLFGNITKQEPLAGSVMLTDNPSVPFSAATLRNVLPTAQ